MTGRKRYVMKKVKDTSGETLIEVLAALLISALAILMLGQAVGSSVRMIRNSEDFMNEYYTANNVLAVRAGGAAGSAEVVITVEGEPVSDELWVDYYVNEIGSDTVVSYGLRN